jgi:hypothetical protein
MLEGFRKTEVLSGSELFCSSEKRRGETCRGNHPDRHLNPRAHRRPAHLAPVSLGDPIPPAAESD